MSESDLGSGTGDDHPPVKVTLSTGAVKKILKKKKSSSINDEPGRAVKVIVSLPLLNTAGHSG